MPLEQSRRPGECWARRGEIEIPVMSYGLQKGVSERARVRVCVREPENKAGERKLRLLGNLVEGRGR